jgi:hypothetical protein
LKFEADLTLAFPAVLLIQFRYRGRAAAGDEVSAFAIQRHGTLPFLNDPHTLNGVGCKFMARRVLLPLQFDDRLRAGNVLHGDFDGVTEANGIEEKAILHPELLCGFRRQSQRDRIVSLVDTFDHATHGFRHWLRHNDRTLCNTDRFLLSA